MGVLDLLHWSVRLDSESVAEARLDARSSSGVASISGRLRGPYCEYARTLAADFPFANTEPAEGGTAAATAGVYDLCCWSPAMPFQYELQAQVCLDDGTTEELLTRVCLRQWHVDGPSFRLQRKRTVLRGAALAESVADIESAHRAEACLLLNDPTEAVCSEADRLGVGLLANLTAIREEWIEVSRRLDWHDSVLLTVVTPEQAASDYRPERSFVAVIARMSDEQAKVLGCRPDAVVFEVPLGETPPLWAIECGLPVLAIRPGVGCDDAAEARAASDRLQAELAPEFDLAGYFVV